MKKDTPCYSLRNLETTGEGQYYTNTYDATGSLIYTMGNV